MICAWKEFLSILPMEIRKEADKFENRSLQELRLRIKSPPEYVFADHNHWYGAEVTREDITHIINTASRYSPWCASTISQGYLTAQGGHRIGLCGDAVIKNGKIEGIREIRSLCIRIAKDFPGIGKEIAQQNVSILILGAPGWGKTTLLRDIIRQISQRDTVCVVDERGELFPVGLDTGKRTDILTGCSKKDGIECLLRTMSPQWIAVDEITAEGDCSAIVAAAGCGVRLLATAHAGSLEEFYCRKVYHSLIAHSIFPRIVCLRKDKSFQLERV